MRIPGVQIIAEKRHSTPAEREEYRMTHADAGENGNGKARLVTISPTALGTLILTLLGVAGGGGFVARGSTTAEADHDQITAMAIELRVLKAQVDKIDLRGEDTNNLVRRLYYSLRPNHTADEPATTRQHPSAIMESPQ